MLKKILAVLLAVTFILSLAACGKKEPTEPIDLPDKKVAVLVAPKEQYPEDYLAAQELAAAYPDNVIIKEYSDSRILKAGNPPIMQLSQELAKDSSVGAIVYARATQYTSLAISSAKKINPDLLTLCIEPEDLLDSVSSFADLVLCADWENAASDIISTAKKNGAKYFVMFSFNRHTENPLYAAEKSYFENICKENEITFIYDNSLDPTFSGGMEQSKLYARESVARLIQNKTVEGTDVVLFSTDSSVQSTLVTIARERGFMYICPSFPTAYNGVSESVDIALPEKISDTASYIKALSEALPDDDGRLFAYSYPLASTLLGGAVITAFDMLTGKTTAENLAERVSLRLGDLDESGTLTVKADGDYPNVFACYSYGFEKLG